MIYRNDSLLKCFEFHDSDWKLIGRDGDAVTFEVRHLNIRRHTDENEFPWDMELTPTRLVFHGFQLIHLEPGRSWTENEAGEKVPVGPRILYTGEEGMALLAREEFCVFHFEQSGDHWELGGAGAEPYFTVEFDFDSAEICSYEYLKKAWYERKHCLSFQVVLDTPEGLDSGKLEVDLHEGDARNSLEGNIKGLHIHVRLVWKDREFIALGKLDREWIDAVADLQKKLPEGVVIRCCMTCRYGNLCPYGNVTGEIFCLRGIPVSEKMDVCDAFDNDDMWQTRKQHYFDYCDHWAETTPEQYTYNDFPCYMGTDA